MVLTAEFYSMPTFYSSFFKSISYVYYIENFYGYNMINETWTEQLCRAIMIDITYMHIQKTEATITC
jgi:hypothetical protein